MIWLEHLTHTREERSSCKVSVGKPEVNKLFLRLGRDMNSKLRMYKTSVRPVVTYACETWVLKENIKTKLRVFERKVLRRIYGPTKEKDGTWRIKSNEELNRLVIKTS
jgi:hypothetical protein